MFAYINTITHGARNIRRPPLILCIPQFRHNQLAVLITPAVCPVFLFRTRFFFILIRHIIRIFSAIPRGAVSSVFPWGYRVCSLIFFRDGFCRISHNTRNRCIAQNKGRRHASTQDLFPSILLHVNILPSRQDIELILHAVYHINFLSAIQSPKLSRNTETRNSIFLPLVLRYSLVQFFCIRQCTALFYNIHKINNFIYTCFVRNCNIKQFRSR